MKCLVCEGKNDLTFFEEALSNTFRKKDFPVHNSMDDFYNLFRSKFHPFYSEQHDCVIYGEGGKRKLFVNVMIPLVNEVFGRQDFNKQDHHRFFVVVDADGVNPSELCAKYYKAIVHTIKSKKIKRFSCKASKDKTCFDFFSPSDTRCRCFVKTSHIPISLERELISKGFERKIHENREKVFTDLQSLPIHEALENLASRLELSVKQLIQMSVSEGWFENDFWYQEINRDLESYFFN